VLLVVTLLAALLLGRLAGGSGEALGTLALRRTGLVLAALGAQAVGAVVGGPVFALGLAASAALAAAFLAANRAVRGTGLVALGLAANALVVGLNGAMPVSAGAAEVAGVRPADLTDARHEVLGAGTRLPRLGDVVPVRLPLRPEVVSPGDVLVAAGLAQLVVVGMLSQRRTGRPLPALPPRPGSGPAPQAAGPPTPSSPARSRRPSPGPSGSRRSPPRWPLRGTPGRRS
jgi:hypothetical protein